MGRVGKICKMFNLSKDDDVRDYVVRRKVKTKNGNKITKKPKIQRLITPGVLQRRKQLKKKVARRKQASYEKRKAYFERLTSKSKEVRSEKKNVEDSVKRKRKRGKKRNHKANSGHN